MVRKFAPFVNYPISYITIFKGLMRFANLGGKPGHPQIHGVRLGGVGNEIQDDHIKPRRWLHPLPPRGDRPSTMCPKRPGGWRWEFIIHGIICQLMALRSSDTLGQTFAQ